MRSIAPYVALLMVYLMVPGSGELTENVVHLLATGHGAHALDDAEHTAGDAEHHCNGAMHICPCHTSSLFTVALPDLGVEPETATIDTSDWSLEDSAADGYLLGVFRPPTS